MPIPGEHKTVQSRILQYANEIGWSIVSRKEAEARRGFDSNGDSQAERARNASIYFDELLHEQVLKFNPKYVEGPIDLVRRLRLLKANIFGNRDHLEYLRNQGKFFCIEDDREYDLVLINYDDITMNKFEVTEEFYFHNGSFGTREDVVFLINGIPILVIECKNASKDEAIALGIDQVRRYHAETPEILVPEMIFSATEAIGFAYGITWNTVRRNIFNWKHEQQGHLEMKVKSFCKQEHILSLLQNYIIFAEKDEQLNKYILRQHQAKAVEKVVGRCHDEKRQRGLVWHTQGSGKTFTMIKASEILFRAPESDKPTILLMIDRNELEDQMQKNLISMGIKNVQHAKNIKTMVELLKADYRGIIVTTIHKFRGMPANLNLRSNIYVMIDEAHRTTGGDLGNYLMAGVPNASFIGFTGTPIDKTVYGKGTFKTFGIDDDSGFLHKYSIQESIEDGTTLPLFYNLAPNEMLANKDLMEKEFWAIAETEGVADIAELNKILDRAVNLKNFLKGKARVQKIAKYIAEHYVENVEPLGYKAFLVAVDRPACAMYKKALDNFLPPEYSEVVYTGTNNDSLELKAHHIDDKEEKQIRKNFSRIDENPKILIVTQKLLTGFDAPILYAMYLDKPMRDHTLLQAIARVNRPYENEKENMVKPHGFVLDFVGIFDKLEKALSFDSDEVNAIVKDLQLLKILFEQKMKIVVPKYLNLVKENFNDKDVDNIIEHFRDKERRKEFIKEFKEIEMLYEIISPDEFMHPFISIYATFSAIYDIVRKAYSKKVYVDRAFQKKTNNLVQKHIDTGSIESVNQFVEINSETIEVIKNKQCGDSTKVINLIKSIQVLAEKEADDPFLIAMAERAKVVQESFEDRQKSTQEALESLLTEINLNENRKIEQAKKGFDSLSFFVLNMLNDANVSGAESATSNIKDAFIAHPNWKISDADLRELRNKVTFEVLSKEDDMDKVVMIVENLFSLLLRIEVGR